MSPLLLIIFLMFFSSFNLFSQQLRGTWIARSAFTNKETLSKAMDSLAANNFNVVYVNVWSRGYPLWNSSVFESHTAIKIDPTYAGRDILAEAIAEAHRNGLLVEAWFEYGFVGGWTGNMPAGQKGPIFNAHPDWVAKKIDGTEKDANNFYWMIHTHPQVQNFLISMAAEIARNYDVDGIQMDRIRYSSLDYGYDSVTINLYKSEHGGASPPANTSNSAWIRWRADKLNEFVSRLYDSLKAINQYLNISNAPSHYSSSSYTAYNNFCQDWIWWVDNNKVDNVQLQMYVSSTTTFGNYLNYVNNNVINKSKVYPSFAIKPGGTTISDSDLLNFFNITTQKGFNGNAIWYYDDLIPKMTFIKYNYFTSKTYPPYSQPDWREFYRITEISDTSNAQRTGSWFISSLSGYSGNSIYTTSASASSLKYFFSIPKSAYYEVYVFNVISSNRHLNAEYQINDFITSDTIYINQTLSNNSRWFKLGDYYLTEGHKLVVQLTNNGLPADRFLSADAVFISLNRRLSPIDLNTSVSISLIPEGIFNPVSNTLLKKDTIIVELKNISPPYSTIDSSASVIDSLNFTAELNFKHLNSGKYYIVISHRNSIETWSRFGGEYLVKGGTFNYNFILDSSQAFGNNLKLIGNKWCIFSGDVNQDNVINSLDLNLISDYSTIYSSENLITDLNSDGITDIEDLVVCDNNVFRNISTIKP